jgi:energy-coupling factor transport system permease protein
MRFDSWHPAVNFIFFAAVITAAITFNQPVFLLIGYGASFAYSVYLGGRRGLIFDVVLLVLIILYAWFYSAYNHFGVTDLGVNFAGNKITLESIVSGLVIATKAASVVMWIFCMHCVVSSDKVVYLFGRISPRLSLYFSILLRTVPRIGARSRSVNEALKGVGRGAGQGSIPRRIANRARIFSIVLTWVIETMADAADSMKSRGYTLRGRTAFSIYRFDYRDRSFVLFFFLCVSIVSAGAMLDQTRILYRPTIVMNRITPASFVFYFAYALMCLTPMILQIAGEIRFARARKGVV